MKSKLAATGVVIGLLLSPVMSYVHADVSSSRPVTFVKDSVITAKIKAKLAAENFATATQLRVDTDEAGAVWLSGTAATDADAAKAVSIARGTEGVSSVKSEIIVKRDDAASK